MQTTIIIFDEEHSDQRSVRFVAKNAPNLLVGDTFQLPILVNVAAVTVAKRHWSGQDLIVKCGISKFGLEYLLKKSEKMKLGSYDYALPQQDCSEPFPGTLLPGSLS